MSEQNSVNAILGRHPEDLWAVLGELIEWDAFVRGCYAQQGRADRQAGS